jgi:hypothetical protein
LVPGWGARGERAARSPQRPVSIEPAERSRASEASRGGATLRVTLVRVNANVTKMSLKNTLLKQGLRLMSDPRVMKLMQDERFMRAVMAAMSVPGKATSFAKEQIENAAKAMSLATEAEVKDLRRTVRKLEDELRQMKNEHSPSRRNSTAAE